LRRPGPTRGIGNSDTGNHVWGSRIPIPDPPCIHREKLPPPRGRLTLNCQLDVISHRVLVHTDLVYIRVFDPSPIFAATATPSSSPHSNLHVKSAYTLTWAINRQTRQRSHAQCGSAVNSAYTARMHLTYIISDATIL